MMSAVVKKGCGGCFFLLVACVAVLWLIAFWCAITVDSYDFSSDYRLYETDVDGEPWYKIESSKAEENVYAPFGQCVDGVYQKDNLVFIWVNGTSEPDYYCINLDARTCTRLHNLPAYVHFVSPRQFLDAH